MKRFVDKVAVVTGGSGGLGKAVVSRLAEEGAKVVVADIDADAAASVAGEIESAGGSAIAVKVDMKDRAEVHGIFETAVDRYGRVDVLVNNAGITRYKQFSDLDDEVWDPVLAVNLKGVFYGAQAAAIHMVRQKYGKIVNISSTSGTGTTPHATGGPGGSVAYGCSKAAVIQLTKTLARELGPHGVNVNCVAPGFFLTSLIHKARTPEQVQAHIALRAKSSVLNRNGTPEEIASGVLYLASDEASFIAGHTLYVDGGRTDRM